MDRSFEFSVRDNNGICENILVDYLKENALGDESGKCSCRETLKIVYDLKSDTSVLVRGYFYIEKGLGGMLHVSGAVKKGEDEKINSDVLEVLACNLPADVVRMIPKELR